MTRWIAFAGIILCGLAAVIVGERNNIDVQASPAAILYFVADTEREITRMPMHLTRMSDEEEIRIGNDLARIRRAQRFRPRRRTRSRYIQEVGARIAAHAKRRLPYEFHYIPDVNFVNAFAIPGGHVFIGKGLVSLWTQKTNWLQSWVMKSNTSTTTTAHTRATGTNLPQYSAGRIGRFAN